MKFKFNTLLLFICLLFLGCTRSNVSTKTADTLPATALQPYGRFLLNQDQNLELISSAVHFGFSFEGKECQVFASLPNSEEHNYLQYELDGVYQKRIKIYGNSREPIRITVPTPGKHTLWFYKATEAHTGPIVIQKITGKKIKSITKPKQPLIEFIGNSITCGAAADPSEVPCGTGVYHDQHNAYMAYGPRVARGIGTDFVLSSVSGIGVYRNWNSNGPTMPQVYEKLDFQEKNPQSWNFATITPQIVSIALGTNDFSKGDGKKERLPFDSASFVNNYIQFVQSVKTKYPKAQIALLSSPMINGSNRTLLQNCLTVVKQRTDASHPSDKPVALYFFQPMQARGCTGHPNVEDHCILAAELIPFFKYLLPKQPE
ncbi:MAG: GDSL-type esterase/lipase family protein [Bacteroidota bacterium]|nr:GDSL-type esterase/lipase family protein [Bacteroidota bacterium]